MAQQDLDLRARFAVPAKAFSVAIATAKLKELRCKIMLNNMASLEFGNFVNSDSVSQLNGHFVYELQRSYSNCEAHSI